MLTDEDRIRYSRMISVQEIGTEGVVRLKNARVLIVGAGALGSLCAMYLAGTGVGELTVTDFDTIDISNLPRQLFYTTCETGEYKARILEGRMTALNPDCKVTALTNMVTVGNAEKLFKDYDFIVDATDNPASKYNTDKVCQKLGKHYCIGGVSGFRGQVMSSGPGYVSYSDVFSPEGVCAGITPCSVSGVVGPAAGVISCIQASEAIKHITGTGDMLYNKLYSIDLATMQSNLFIHSANIS